MFHCQTEGQPQPQILWKRLPFTDVSVSTGLSDLSPKSIGVDTTQYQLIRSGPHYQVFENGTLRISEVHATVDLGQFLCHANNGIGPGLSKIVMLHVNGKIEQLKTFYEQLLMKT